LFLLRLENYIVTYTNEGVMSARAKWGLYYAVIEGNDIIPGRSAKKYGEGSVNENRIKAEIIPWIKERGLELPILIKTYFSKKPSTLDLSTRGGKPVFEPAYPIREEFAYLITKDFKVENVQNQNIGNLKDNSPKS